MHACFFQYYCNQGTWSRLSQYLTRDTVLSTKVGHETTVLSLCYGRRLIAVILPIKRLVYIHWLTAVSGGSCNARIAHGRAVLVHYATCREMFHPRFTDSASDVIQRLLAESRNRFYRRHRRSPLAMRTHRTSACHSAAVYAESDTHTTCII